jgi:hypothetical protein
MRPGKRPGNPRSNASRRAGSNQNDSGEQLSWSISLANQLQRCIATHDLEHILDWHTPAYTAAVAASLIAVLLGASTFSGWFVYLALCAAAAMLIGGVGSWLEIESGPNAVLVPVAEQRVKVRSKQTLEANFRTLFTNCHEPLLNAASSQLFPATVTKRWLVGLAIVSVVAELAKVLSTGVVLALVVVGVFAYTGVRRLQSLPASSTD